MSTPRERQRNVSQSPKVLLLSGYDLFGTGSHSYPPVGLDLSAADSYSKVKLGYTGIESRIEDFVTSQKPRPFQECAHEYSNATVARTVISVNHPNSQYNNVWQMNCRVDHRISEAAALNLISSCDYPTMLVKLGQLVRDRLDGEALLGATLRDLGKTVKMIKNPFRLMKSDWRSRAAGLTPATLAKKGADLWLEGKYGWQALYYDLKGFGRSLTKYCAKANEIYLQSISCPTYRVRRSFPGIVSAVTPMSSYHYGGSDFEAHMPGDSIIGGANRYHAYRVDLSGITAHCAVGCKAAEHVEKHFNALTDAFDALGCNASSLVETLWEIMPYSFVVDWFVNTKAIRQLPTLLPLLVSSKCTDLGYSIRLERIAKVKIIPNLGGFAYWPYSVSPRVYGGTFGTGTGPIVSAETIARTYLRKLGLPGMTLSQFFGTDLHWTQGVSGVGLIIQRAIH